jgi:hypothetical protein
MVVFTPATGYVVMVKEGVDASIGSVTDLGSLLFSLQFYLKKRHLKRVASREKINTGIFCFKIF